ncbi:hypothetical protein EON65_34340 [archaeon]|nr:MAG: hypothetical protein EON65_34340 [archaeon]
MNARTKRRLARMVQSGDVDNAPELSLTAASHDIVLVSASTACNVRHQEGLQPMHLIRKPLLTGEHKRKSLDFARAHCVWTEQQWKHSDETVIPVRSSDAHKIKWINATRGLNPKLVVPTVQGGGVAIMTYGCILQYCFHDLILLDGTVDAKGYSAALKDYLLPVIHQHSGNHPCVFQQNNAAVHTAHEVAIFFHTHHLQVLARPANSPDLNIIGHMWHYLKEGVRQLPIASSKENL